MKSRYSTIQALLVFKKNSLLMQRNAKLILYTYWGLSPGFTFHTQSAPNQSGFICAAKRQTGSCCRSVSPVTCLWHWQRRDSQITARTGQENTPQENPLQWLVYLRTLNGSLKHLPSFLSNLCISSTIWKKKETLQFYNHNIKQPYFF